MKQVDININSNAKNILNQMILERDGLGYDYIIKKVSHLKTELNQIDNLDRSIKVKLIRLLVNESKTVILRDSTLPEDMKSHLVNLIDTIGKIEIRKIENLYVLFDPTNLKRPNSKLYRTLKSIERGKKRQEKLDNKTYEWCTLLEHKQLQYKKNKNVGPSNTN